MKLRTKHDDASEADYVTLVTYIRQLFGGNCMVMR